MNAHLKRGYVQVYTGSGKGKTTAAMGLALRAAGAGLKVFMGQFLKAAPCGERRALRRFRGNVTVKTYGRRCFVRGTPSDADVQAAAAGLKHAESALVSGKYDVVILDEVCVAVRLGLLAVGAVLSVVDRKPVGVELVLTGRNAHRRIIERADLVTEMRQVKHYYARGVKARRGIEM